MSGNPLVLTNQSQVYDILIVRTADAILNALRESVDVILVEAHQTEETPGMMVNGKWVFIPDDIP